MENARVYCCQGILNCHMTFAGSVISLARPESWPRIAMISKKLAIVTIRISATPPSQKKSRDYLGMSLNTISLSVMMELQFTSHKDEFKVPYSRA